MRILICGAGKVGFNTAKYLAEEGNDVTVVDQSLNLIANINEQLDVQAYVGHAAHPDILEKAGAAHADMIIAVTPVDEINMLICQVAYTLFNTPRRIARIREQSYLNPKWQDLFSRDHLPVDVIISPEKEIAQAIARRLKVPGALDSLKMAEGKVSVVSIRCDKDCPLLNTPLRQLTSLFPDLNVRILVILRDDSLVLPNGQQELYENDEVYFVADTQHVSRAMIAFGYEEEKIQRIVIAGAGDVGLHLARILEASDENYSIRIIEKSMERAQKVAETLPTVNVLNGDAMDTEILEEASIEDTDLFVAVTDTDQNNTLVGLLAKKLGAKYTLSLINQMGYSALISQLGIDIIVSAKEITISKILEQVRRGRIRSIHALRDRHAEIIEADAMETSSLVGHTLEEASLPEGMIIGAIVRNGEVIIPHHNTEIKVKDRIILMASSAAVKEAEKLFSVRPEYF